MVLSYLKLKLFTRRRFFSISFSSANKMEVNLFRKGNFVLHNGWIGSDQNLSLRLRIHDQATTRLTEDATQISRHGRLTR